MAPKPPPKPWLTKKSPSPSPKHAYAGPTIRRYSAPRRATSGPSLNKPIGYGLVIGLITYLSVVIGELVPKHLALKNAEGIACAVAPLMARVSRTGAPVVWLLDASTELVFRLLGKSTENQSAVTEEEVRTIVAEAETAGAI